MLRVRRKAKSEAEPVSGPGAPEIPEDVGRVLRRTRESFGQDLGRIAQALRIKRTYLDAIEKGHHDRLPGPAYAIGFVRTYAEFLGLNGEELAAEYRREIQGVRGDSDLSFLAPAPESKVPGGAVFLISALVAALAYGSWYYIANEDRNFVELIPELPDRLKTMIAEEETVLDEALSTEISIDDIGEPEASPLGDETASPAGEVMTPFDDELQPSTAESPMADEFLEPPLETEGDLPSTTEDLPPIEAASLDQAAQTAIPDIAEATGQAETDISLPAELAESSSGEIEGTMSPVPEETIRVSQTGSANWGQGTVIIQGRNPLASLPPAPASPAPQPSENQFVGGTPPQNFETPTTPSLSTDPVEDSQSLASLTKVAPPEFPTSVADDSPPTAEILDPTALPNASTADRQSSSPALGAALGRAENASGSASTAAAGNAPAANDPQSAALIPAAPSSGDMPSLGLAPEPKVYGEANVEARIVLRATMDCWVQVRDANGSLLLTRVLRPGDSYRVPNQPELSLLTGNAGGLEILVDGIAIPPLGPVGTVRRDVPLDPGRLRNGTALAR